MGLETIDSSSNAFKINCQKTIRVVILISLEIELIISSSDSDMDSSESKFPRLFFCWIK